MSVKIHTGGTGRPRHLMGSLITMCAKVMTMQRAVNPGRRRIKSPKLRRLVSRTANAYAMLLTPQNYGDSSIAMRRVVQGPYNAEEGRDEETIALATRGRDIARKAVEASPSAAHYQCSRILGGGAEIRGSGCPPEPLYQPYYDAVAEYKARYKSKSKRADGVGQGQKQRRRCGIR